MSTPFPPSLVLQLSETYGLDESAFIAAHVQSRQLTSIRINPVKGMPPDPVWPQVPWCNHGFYLPERPLFTADPLFHAGSYYVQDASSMFIAHVIQQLGLAQNPLSALDLCAAPGGKSTLLNSLLHPHGLLIANEPLKTRVHILSDNLTRWGHHNTVVTNNDPSAFNRLPGYFDLILADAPCSGSGMFRKDPTAIAKWSESAVKLCSQRQQRILKDSLSSLKEGGIFIYSTCSYSTAENEDIIDWLCDTLPFESIPVTYPETWGIEETLSAKHKCHGYRFYPHKLMGEGLFISVLRKTGAQKSAEQRTYKAGKKRIDPTIVQQWISPGTVPELVEVGEELFMVPQEHAETIHFLRSNLYFKKAGTKLGKIIGNKFIPHHELALSNALHPAVNRADLELPEALNFLRKRDIHIPINQKGWVLITYKGKGLGWVKNLANRINNYYPKEWRIIHI